jgi:hypothetical protein
VFVSGGTATFVSSGSMFSANFSGSATNATTPAALIMSSSCGALLPITSYNSVDLTQSGMSYVLRAVPGELVPLLSSGLCYVNVNEL